MFFPVKNTISLIKPIQNVRSRSSFWCELTADLSTHKFSITFPPSQSKNIVLITVIQMFLWAFNGVKSVVLNYFNFPWVFFKYNVNFPWLKTKFPDPEEFFPWPLETLLYCKFRKCVDLKTSWFRILQKITFSICRYTYRMKFWASIP